MNRKMILYGISRIMITVSLLMILPIIVGLCYKEDSRTIFAFLKTIALIFIIFLPFSIKKPESYEIYAKEGFIITSSVWILLSFFGGLPLYFSGEVNSVIDSFFEMSSGFTTTGASIIEDLSVISHSILFWRSFSHFIGGMGVLVFGLAVLPEVSASSVHAMKAEVPGPQFGKLLPRVQNSARILYIIYVVMTIILIVALVIAGMPFFDSMLHAFGAAGTGGFGIKNGSVQYYNSLPIEIILGIGMLMFGINFNLYYFILIGKWKDAIKSEELRVYLAIVFCSIFLIVLNIMPSYQSVGKAIRDAFFTVSSIITTTGYSTADYSVWPTFSKWILIMLMFFGACAGSTAGGLKISRIIIFVKSTFREIKRNLNRNRKLPIMYEGKSLDKFTEESVSNYLAVYFLLFALLTLITSINAPDFETTFSAVVATFNNIGPGLGKVGPSGNYAVFSNLSKLTMSFAMIIGRLELFPVLILFSPSTWKDN